MTRSQEFEGGVLRERARSLFEFLGRVQGLRSAPVRTADEYRRGGAVIWFADLPRHGAVASAHRGGDPEADAPLVTVERVARVAPPEPGERLRPWVAGEVDDPEQNVELREAVAAERVPWLEPRASVEEGRESQVRLADHPEVRAAFDAWLDGWEAWAEAERAARPVRELYGELFSTYVKATGHPEELELVLGVGCLAWHPEQHVPVRRHLLTVPAVIAFDDDTGRLTVAPEPGSTAFTVEDDMLDPGVIRHPQHIVELKAAVQEFDGHPLHRDGVGALVRRIVHTLDADGAYQDDETAPVPGADAVAAYAPALILRKRSHTGLMEIFRTIVARLGEAEEVPAGLLPLVDPDQRPPASADTTPGAVVAVDDEIFLPLPVNERQLKVLRAVDTQAQTVVQGPPGTGKTHTAAALLSHLLAQGKRVLVTAHTDRALKEVRDKLPTAIKPLSVAVVGSSRSDMADLRVAVDRIAANASEHDPDEAQRTIDAALDAIDTLRRRRAAAFGQLLQAREQEVVEHRRGPYEGSLAAIAQRYRADAATYGWLTGFAQVSAESEPPITDAELAEWLALLRDAVLLADEPEAGRRLVDADALPDPRTFAELCDAERAAATASARYSHLTEHEAFERVRALDPEARRHLQQRMRALAGQADALAQRREAWMNGALYDIRVGRADIWQNRGHQVDALIRQAMPLVDALGPLTRVDIAPEPVDVAGLVLLARSLLAHLQSGHAIKTDGAGQPRVGRLAAKPVRDAAPLFRQARVNGLPPTGVEQIGAFLTSVEAHRLVDALDRAWPTDIAIPEDTLRERLQWHVTELRQLRLVLALGDELAAEQRRLADLGLKHPDWTDLDAVRTYADLVDAATAQDTWARTRDPLAALEERAADAARWEDAAPCVRELHHAVSDRDHDAYLRAHARLTRLHEVRAVLARRAALARRLDTVPRLRDAVLEAPEAPVWDVRLPQFEAAWTWACTGAWILSQDTTDANVLQAQINAYDDRIRHEVETLAATRAWSHAVSPGRLTGQARADLRQYVDLVRRFGKTGGRYRAQRSAEIRRAMDRCRPAVPVWIMPIYRIAEQFDVHENMFDVVIVDEASQAGLEAVFLQYLAPKIVVIGDDKQVSPAAVGVDQQQLRDLADQYLAHDRYKASWQDPQRSLFDEALMRYGGLITLVEHRRCVPEIIGFSNRVAYEPAGVRLIPVRQYGADRLDPIRAVHVADGYVQGGMSNRVNPSEVDAVVDQIEKCLADPRYDGLTFGVISLLGSAQARAIESRLLDRVPPEEWAARDLRCGDAPDFQGSERDVMFLSMVAATDPERRLPALTRDTYVQRYNVAVSRAKDQVWLFHSVTLDDLGNPEDMRFALLDYCYGVIGRTRVDDERVLTTAVPEDVHVAPFDSLFEQRVFNRLNDRGHTVIPQYPAEGYRIDLVVVGAHGRLAIECDGDTWHGPDAHEADLARQRDLERCGWRFFRIRESAFYVDQAATLDKLWHTLHDLGIHPSHWSAEEPDAAAPEAPDEGIAGTDDDGDADDPPDDDRVDADVAPDDEPEAQLPDAAPPLARQATGPPVTAAVIQRDAVSADSAPTPDSTGLRPYTAFTGTVAPPRTAPRQNLVDGLVAIVAVEGPVCNSRLHRAYVTASGGQRVTEAIAKRLNIAIDFAVRRRLLILDNPLAEPGHTPCTYRLPTQPEALCRTLGPRQFDQIPPRELAALMTSAAADEGWDDHERLFRNVLTRLGLTRLTANVAARLAAVLPLARGDGTE